MSQSSGRALRSLAQHRLIEGFGPHLATKWRCLQDPVTVITSFGHDLDADGRLNARVMIMNHPVIVLGMHRSGTSMLTRVLRAQGLFLGHQIHSDDEATFFFRLNRWMLSLAGTDWDNPVPAVEMLRDDANVARIADYTQTRLSGPETWRFLGGKAVSAGMRIGTQLPFAWGFKDPRTSITLPVWLKLFPAARLLRIRRHGLDVAASLRARHFDNHRFFGRFGPLTRLGLKYPARLRMIDAPRCATISGGLALWAEYETTLSAWQQEVAPDRQMTLKFEDYVTDPARYHAEIGEFLGMNLAQPLSGATRPDPERAHAYRKDPELLAAETAFAPLLTDLGY
jgi:hypothetical protein